MKKGLRCALSLVLVMATLFSVFGGVLVYAEDLAAIGADFNSIVESIDDSSGLVEKKEKIDLAEVKLGQYTAAGGAYTDALIADAYAEYLLKKDAVEKTIADCLEFIRIVEMAQGEELSYPEVRAYLVRLQQETAKGISIVMDGRDIGTKVLPDATLKLYITASPEVRALRRYAELRGKGEMPLYHEVLNDIVERDYNDSHRAASPLVQAEDAHLLDTSNMTKEAVLDEVVRLAHMRIGG